MSSDQQNKEELDARARRGETVVPGGTGGKSLEAQEHLAEEGGAEEDRQGRSSWGQKGTRRWFGKVGLAPQKILGESGLRKRGSPSMSPSSGPEPRPS